MVAVSYSRRILIDSNFIKFISRRGDKSFLITKMLRINQNSLEHKKENIVILEKEFNSLCKEGIIKDKDMIKGSIYPFDIGEDIIEKITDGVEVTDTLIKLILGVLMTKEEPFQVVLLTTNEGKKEYEPYKDFLEKIPNFSIKCEDESITIIDNLYKNYTLEKDKSR